MHHTGNGDTISIQIYFVLFFCFLQTETKRSGFVYVFPPHFCNIKMCKKKPFRYMNRCPPAVAVMMCGGGADLSNQ